ncbi:MAG TPA: SlyX family protein, partial [Phycisphaerae bacterium]|nr:SlyX family protein [Phycisphaerae bacterium]
SRILRLEEKLAFQEKTIADLDEVVTAINLKFSELTRGFEDITKMVRQLDADRAERHRNGDEKPPHYGGLGSAAHK